MKKIKESHLPKGISGELDNERLYKNMQIEVMKKQYDMVVNKNFMETELELNKKR